jgi:two-component system CheB/CheR fusion protein
VIARRTGEPMDERHSFPGTETYDYLVVGVGTSQWSGAALREFFRHLPPDPGAAFVAPIVDRVLPPAGIARTLAAYARHRRSMRAGPPGVKDRRQEIGARLPEICQVLFSRTGHDFSQYKPSTLVRRIERRMQVRSLDGAASYAAHLAADPQESDLLLRELLIGVTSFFRAPDAFAALAEQVIAPWAAGRSASERVRIWVPGCATGEEAYSIAMVVREAIGAGGPKAQIFFSRSSGN